MADRPINQAPEESSALYSLYARKNNTTNNLIQIPAKQFAHSVGFSASDKGKIPYIDANGDYANLAVGTNGKFLKLDSGLPTWGDQATEIVSTTTISSSVASVVLTIPTGYAMFTLIGINVISANAAANENLLLQTSIDGGSTFRTTSGDYYAGSNVAGTVLGQASIPAATSTFQHGVFIMEIIGLGKPSQATVCFPTWYMRAASTTSVAGTVSTNAIMFMRMVAEQENAVRLVTAGGNNLTAGTIILMGVPG